ncbi:extensin [Streptomyces globosus]|uniref:extensin n=1 Tax=Streptomyces globosus TaxID=68209 RepID=UPI003800D672
MAGPRAAVAAAPLPLASGRPLVPAGPGIEGPAVAPGGAGPVVLRRPAAAPDGAPAVPVASLGPRGARDGSAPAPGSAVSAAPPAAAAPIRPVPPAVQRAVPAGPPPGPPPAPAPARGPAPVVAAPHTPPAPLSGPPPAPPAAAAPAAGPAAAPQAELDALARHLVAPISRLLRAELRGDRERLGRLRDR